MSKIILIGCGAVGTSFLYSSINQGLCNEYGLIDVFENTAIGNVLDLEDSIYFLNKKPKIFHATYKDLKDADFILISAGRAQKPGETRLDMVKDNSNIIKNIAKEIKNSGFSGITLICANPVDILTYVYIKETGFNPKKVIGSGTILDTSRLNLEIAKNLNVSLNSIQNAYVLGEHGDSSVVSFSNIKILNKNLSELNCSFTEENYEELLEKVVAKKAYKIIEKKRSTFYGIGAGMSKILKSIIEDSNDVVVVGALCTKEYGLNDIVLGVPCVLNKNGIKKIIEISLNKKEYNKLHNSAKIIKLTTQKVCSQ